MKDRPLKNRLYDDKPNDILNNVFSFQNELETKVNEVKEIERKINKELENYRNTDENLELETKFFSFISDFVNLFYGSLNSFLELENRKYFSPRKFKYFLERPRKRYEQSFEI